MTEAALRSEGAHESPGCEPHQENSSQLKPRFGGPRTVPGESTRVINFSILAAGLEDGAEWTRQASELKKRRRLARRSVASGGQRVTDRDGRRKKAVRYYWWHLTGRPMLGQEHLNERSPNARAKIVAVLPHKIFRTLLCAGLVAVLAIAHIELHFATEDMKTQHAALQKYRRVLEVQSVRTEREIAEAETVDALKRKVAEDPRRLVPVRPERVLAINVPASMARKYDDYGSLGMITPAVAGPEAARDSATALALAKARAGNNAADQMSWGEVLIGSVEAGRAMAATQP